MNRLKLTQNGFYLWLIFFVGMQCRAIGILLGICTTFSTLFLLRPNGMDLLPLILIGVVFSVAPFLVGWALGSLSDFLEHRAVVIVDRGESPLILCFPHIGTFLPTLIQDQLNENGKILADTDWHLRALYGQGYWHTGETAPSDMDTQIAALCRLLPFATYVWATYHRYLIDVNRDPDGSSLYPGQNTTDIVPLTDFDGQPIWREGQEPTDAEIARRVKEFHAPYHAALAAEIARVKAKHGVAVVYDCHSIRSRISHLFEGTLPDFNIGTDGGRTCAPEIEAAAVEIARAATGYTSVLNGRFRGGWTTRHYGRPEEGVHAIQMELAQSTYLKTEAAPFEYDTERAVRIRVHLRAILRRIEAVANQLRP